MQDHEIPDSVTQPVAPLQEPVAASGSFQMPADYYSQPHPSRGGDKPGCPRWVPITCGLGGCLILIAIFAFGFFVVKGMRSPKLTLWFVSRVEVELRGMMTSDVTPAQKIDFDRESSVLRGRVSRGEVTLLQLSDWLAVTRAAMSDRKLNNEEVTRIIEALKRVNASGGPSLEVDLHSRLINRASCSS